MKVDLSPEAVGVRLAQVESLRRVCLSLALSSAGREVVQRHLAKDKVRRTMAALPPATRSTFSS